MSFLLQALKPRSWLCSLILTAALFLPSVWAQPALFVWVGDTTAYPGQQGYAVPIYVDNYSDTIAGFEFWLQMDRPDVAVFQTDSGIAIDTTYWECLVWELGICVESVLTTPEGEWDFSHVDTDYVLAGHLDTTGTLCSGWEYLDSRSLSGSGYDLDVSGIADMPAPPTTPGIPPQQGGILVKVLADIFDVPDTVCDPITANILIWPGCFSDPGGNCIGTDSVLDTTCYVCTQWLDSICLNWEEVWPPPPEGCDSIATSWEYFLDTTRVYVFDGSITIPPGVCGDCDGDGKVNVADLTCFVGWLFFDGPPPHCAETIMNVDGAGGANVADLTYLVSYLFENGPPPACW